MNTTMNRQWRLAARPVGLVKETDFRLSSEPIPELHDGEYLVRTRYVMVNPAMRLRLIDGAHPMTREEGKAIQLGEVMPGTGTGEVIASKHPEFAVGDRVRGLLGWQEYAIAGGGRGAHERIAPEISLSQALNVIGLNGITAYIGLTDVGRPQPGETVLVSGAAGAVGSAVGQVAKIYGCRVVGLAGSDAKCAWLTNEVGFDAAINYRSEDIAGRLAETCSSGVDIYFDNVGGELLETVLSHLALHARIVLCGMISLYNTDAGAMPAGPRNLMQLVYKEARMEGFSVTTAGERIAEAQQQLQAWFEEGRIRATETALQGFEKLPGAFIQLFTGGNTGQMLVQLNGGSSYPSSTGDERRPSGTAERAD